MTDLEYLSDEFLIKSLKEYKASLGLNTNVNINDRELLTNFMNSSYSKKYPYYCCAHPERLSNNIIGKLCNLTSYETDNVNTTDNCQMYMENYCKLNNDPECSCMDSYEIKNPLQRSLYNFLQKSDISSDVRKRCISTECINKGWIPQKDRSVNVCPALCGNILGASANKGIIHIDDINMTVKCDPSSYDPVILIKDDPNTKPDSKPDTKPDSNPDTKPDTKPDSNPDTKPDTSSYKNIIIIISVSLFLIILLIFLFFLFRDNTSAKKSSQ